MKLCTKKIYCPDCRRLVTCREEAVGNGIRVSCSRCGKSLWLWDGVTWKYTAKYGNGHAPLEKSSTELSSTTAQ